MMTLGAKVGSDVATAAHAVPNRRESPTKTRQRAKSGFQVVRWPGADMALYGVTVRAA